MLSEYENTLKILENYSKTQNGRIPHEIVSNGRVYNSGNLVESLAYPSMIWMYEYTGNSKFLEERKGMIFNSIHSHIRSNLKGTGIMEYHLSIANTYF